MHDLEFGVFLMPDGTAEETIRRIKLCEDLGFAFVGVADSQMLWREVYVILAAAATATTRLRLGPWVTNPFTRHPSVTASAIATLDEISGGRAFLGIGYGDSSVETIGLRSARLAELAETVERIRALSEGKTVATEHGHWKLGVARGSVTIYWAADGPKQYRDAGRYADGVIANGWLVPAHMDWVRERVAEGARDAGREPDSVEIVFNTGVSIAADSATAVAAAKSYVARGLCHKVGQWIPEWPDEAAEEFRKQYDYYHHISEEHEIAERVPDELVTKKAVAGTPDECVDLLRGVIERGFSRIILLPVGDVEQTLETLARAVIPRLGAARADGAGGTAGESGR